MIYLFYSVLCIGILLLIIGFIDIYLIDRETRRIEREGIDWESVELREMRL